MRLIGKRLNGFLLETWRIRIMERTIDCVYKIDTFIQSSTNPVHIDDKQRLFLEQLHSFIYFNEYSFNFASLNIRLCFGGWTVSLIIERLIRGNHYLSFNFVFVNITYVSAIQSS